MPLASGTRIAHYEVTTLLGAGGMGEVYRAKDTRLGREVAIKVLPAALSADSVYMVRFEREAQMLAALNHPNIASIYGLEKDAIVMELVEGQTLEARIRQGQLPYFEVITIAKQIAEALEAAHEKGIVHRDLKPGNVKITPEGVVKVLDFGLAKTAEEASRGRSEMPTIRATQEGAILGTPAYMSPEQARGQRVDHRTDIWAFGVVLFEMVTGRTPFQGDSLQDMLASVLKSDPDINAAPEAFRPLLRRCLERDPHKRLGWIGEVRGMLENPVPGVAPRSTTPAWVIPVLVGSLLLATAFAGLWLRAPMPQEAPVRTFKITPPNLFLEPALETAAISPDGKHIAYLAAEKLWIQDLDRDNPRMVDGADEARMPCWSADSQWLAFSSRGQVWKTMTAGSAPQALFPSVELSGCTWSQDSSSIIWISGTGLNEVAATGGQSLRIDRKLPGIQRSIHSLPRAAGRKVLISVSISRKIALVDLDSKQVEYLGIIGTSAVYSPTGHILYTKPSELYRSEIWAVPFDLKTLKITGPGFPVLTEASGVSLANDGTMIYTDSMQTQIVVRDRTGKQTGTLGLPQSGMTGFAISKDGLIAASALGDGNLDIWIQDFKRGVKTRFTSHPEADWLPKWSPDGKSIAFVSNRDGEYAIYQQSVDGNSPAIRMGSGLLADWSKDGRYILFITPNGLRYFLEGKESGVSSGTLQGPSRTRYPRLSPDGHFVAFGDADNVFVKPFPDGPGQWQISPKGGIQPRWSLDGTEIFYFEGNRIMVVPVSIQGGFSVGTARPLFTASPYTRSLTQTLSRYEPLPDGSFGLLEPVNPPGVTAPSIHVLENFPAFLKRGQAKHP